MNELFVEKQIESKYGRVKLAITRAAHISATLLANFRDTVYNVHIHYSCSDGKWQFENHGSVSVCRTWSGSAKNFNKPIAPTHIEAITKELKIVLDAFITANPDDLVEAQRRYLAYEISHANAEIEKLEFELKQKNANHATLIEELRQLTAANLTPK